MPSMIDAATGRFVKTGSYKKCQGCQTMLYVTGARLRKHCSRKCQSAAARRLPRIRELFFRYVKKTKTCWLWVGRMDPKGYGISRLGPGRSQHSHRVSWFVHNGEIKNGLHVLHDCDNPSCVRPSHLHLGDNKQNHIEASQRGLLKSKVNCSQVVVIRSLKGRESCRSISGRFGISTSTVYAIWSGQNWGHLK